MIAALICVISVAALLQFFVSYSRSIIAAYRRSELSEQVREVAGIQNQELGGEQFSRLLQLVQLCPQKGDDQGDLAVVRTYYRMMGWLKAASRAFSTSIAQWAERERVNCTYFAAVALDRRIAYSRALLAQQMSQH